MGLAPTQLQYILRLHKQRQFRGPVLTLGVQDICATYADVTAWAKKEGTPLVSVPPNEQRRSTSRHFQANGLKNFLHPQTFFRMLGIDGYRSVSRCPYRLCGATMAPCGG